MSTRTFSESYDDTQSRDEALWEYIRDHFGQAAFSVESGVTGPSREPQSPLEAMEYGHIDGIVYDGDIAYGLAMRMHPYMAKYRSFGIRTRARSGSYNTEYRDLLKAMASGALFPKYYVIGFYFRDTLLRDAAGTAFRHVFVLDAETMMTAIVTGDLDVRGPKESGRGNPDDKSEAIYVVIDDLRELDAVVEEWHAAEW